MKSAVDGVQIYTTVKVCSAEADGGLLGGVPSKAPHCGEPTLNAYPVLSVSLHGI